VAAELERARVILDDVRVRAVMANPRVSLEERSAALDGLLEGMSAPARNLVRLLVAHGRFALLTEVVAEYRAIVDAASGVLRIVVSSAVPSPGRPSGGSRGCSPSAWRIPSGSRPSTIPPSSADL